MTLSIEDSKSYMTDDDHKKVCSALHAQASFPVL